MDLSTIFFLLTALGLGLVHSLDPDRVVAVSALLCTNRSLRKSVTSAIVWGIGHSAALLVVGLLVLTLSVIIPQSVIKMFDSAAGILLIILTIVIKPLIAEKINVHQITRPENTYSRSFSSDHDHAYIHLHKSEITGVLQGLGGSAALMLGTLSTVKSVGICLFFICLFGVGVILGIVGIACLVGSVIV